MLISDYIAQMINEMLEANEGILELKRNELALRLGCAPSQINYVITSRFTPQNGYVIESQRGGGGYIRIVRKQMHRDEYLMHFFHAVGSSLSVQEGQALLRNLCQRKLIDPPTAAAMYGAISAPALSAIESRALSERVRADIFRQLLLSQMQ